MQHQKRTQDSLSGHPRTSNGFKSPLGWCRVHLWRQRSLLRWCILISASFGEFDSVSQFLEKTDDSYAYLHAVHAFIQRF